MANWQRICMAGCVALACRAEVIDRIAVIVGNRVITESELLREVRITRFLAGQPLDLSPAVKRQTAERMIDQEMVRRETDFNQYPQPAAADVAKTLQDFKREYYPDEAKYRQALETYRVREEDLKEHIRWQLTSLRFIDLRFAPGVLVSAEEIRQYYTKLGDKAGGSLEEARDTIEKIIREEHINQALDKWLKEVRQQTRVEVREEVLP